MRLSIDFSLHLSDDLFKNANGSVYTTLILETIQSDLRNAQNTVLQEAERTGSILRQTINTLHESSYNLLSINVSDSQSKHLIHPRSETNVTHSKYAYAYVIGGCNPYNPGYRGFIYNILISTKILRDLGSQNDMIVFVQLSYGYTDSTTLPDVDIRALQYYNIHVNYISPSPYESFYDTVLNKFHILQLTQYKRIILMDGDVMPVSNLDYLFHLSDDNIYGIGNSTLKENLVVAGPWEPANAGFFMLTPHVGDYELIQQIILTREEKVKDKDGIKFDEYEGWGHVIEAPDEWVGRKQRGTNWTFHFSFSDQGLLYYWTKYVKKSVSTVYFERVENLSADINGVPKLERSLGNILSKYSKPLVSSYGSCTKFMCDFHHFTGTLKPWLRKPPEDLSNETKLYDSLHLWWHYLKIVDAELELGIDFENWISPGRPTLGLFATWGDMAKRIVKNDNTAE